MVEYLYEALLDAVIDTVKLLPFLFLTYLLMEFLEHRTGERAERFIARAGWLGPIIGGLTGALPQCGFSAAAAGLYAGRVVTAGTLVAVFLSTSDEMVAVMLSSSAADPTVLPRLLTVLAVKIVCAIAVGFAVDLILRRKSTGEIGELCDHEGCHCHEQGILRSSLIHTAKIVGFIFAVTLIINTVIFFVGEDKLGALLHDLPVVGEIVAGLIGLIPNCAASVVLTQLYLSGTLTAGQLLSGLFTGAGVGLLVLFRVNRPLRDSLLMLSILYISGVALGLLLGATGLTAVLGL